MNKFVTQQLSLTYIVSPIIYGFNMHAVKSLLAPTTGHAPGPQQLICTRVAAQGQGSKAVRSGCTRGCPQIL